MANQIDDKPSLPKEYVQLEYLEFTGTQWIDTRITPILSDEIEFECIIKQHSTSQWAIFGSGTGDILWGFVGTYFRANAFGGYYKYFESGGARLTINIPQSTDNLNIINCKNDGYFYVNDVQYFQTPSAFHDVALDTPLYIGTRGNLAMTFTGVIGKFKLIDKDGKLKLNLIPALRIADSKPGMYDLVTGAFMINNGTGEFTFELNIPDTQKPYLCFEAVEDDFQAKYSINPCEYSIDNRKTWNELPADTLTPAISAGSKIYFRGRGVKSTTSPYSRGTFSTTKLFNISGNMLSMVHGSDFLTGTPDDYTYSKMFYGNKNIVSISDDFFNIKCGYRGFRDLFIYSSVSKAILHNYDNKEAQQYNATFVNSQLKDVEIKFKTPTTMSQVFEKTQIESVVFPMTNVVTQGLLYACKDNPKLKTAKILANSMTGSNNIRDCFFNCNSLNNLTFLVTTPLTKSNALNWLINVAEEGTIILNKNITWNPEDYMNGNIDNIEGSTTLGETINWGIPAGWEVKYCDPDNIDDVRDYREIDNAWNELTN